ncbi:hypothetical protein MWK26_32125, partial [Escherichia coli]|nr:hypothetical protein [Escherichia coli]
FFSSAQGQDYSKNAPFAGESTLSLSIRKSAADGRVDCATCEHDPEISEAAKGCSMYMTRGLR